MNSRIFLRLASLTALVLPMAACTPETIANQRAAPTVGTDNELRAHGETVFRLQNTVLDQVISAAQIDAGPASLDSAELLAAEERIVKSCHALNEAARVSAEGHEPDMSLKLRVLESMARCEASALAVRAQLKTATVQMSASSP